ncbi:hypothetical protein Acsp04_64820 [Actinomadura sp. NBRC 104425]|uniref:hypothetical protein n=1 Tax=Actinomadura sp. NBRC 104425 TaxID=3032204 RepID=UPI0024A2E80C|nr:hypothetical protein [Actinomadura sp. NBRC 104425]GLZ16247.1 hypothetical protein Acsp04_64820 [Actinomadura sp. NBRC 104425]
MRRRDDESERVAEAVEAMVRAELGPVTEAVDDQARRELDTVTSAVEDQARELDQSAAQRTKRSAGTRHDRPPTATPIPPRDEAR